MKPSHKSSESPSEKGELITRADGSQVIKVKKRKRRSKQEVSKEAEKQSPFVKWSVLILLLSLLLIPAIGTLVIIAKYNGKSFKELTEANIKSITRADTAYISTLKVTPVSVTAKAFDSEWGDRTFLKKASFKNLNTDILLTTFTSKEWIGEELSAKQGEIHLQKPSNYTPTEKASFADSIYQFNALRCKDLDLHFGETGISIDNLLATIRKTADNQLKFVFQRGTVERKNWPDFVISSGIISNHKDNLSVNALIEAPRGLGVINLNGLINKSTNKPNTLDIEVSKFPLQDLLGEGLTNIFQGDINSSKGQLSYDFSKPSDEALQITIPFQSDSLTMSQLPMFSFIREISSDSSYIEPRANHCTGTLTLTKKTVRIHDLTFISNRLITIKGAISSNMNGEMTGELEVGLPSSIITDKEQPFFSKSIDGFQTIPVTVSGNIHNLHDNLKEQLSAPLPITPQVIKQLTPEEEFDALTR